MYSSCVCSISDFSYTTVVVVCFIIVLVYYSLVLEGIL
jgi:hypothetical protein